MPKLLGSKWQQSKKMPLSVNLVQTRHIKERLEKAVASSCYTSNRGSNISIAIGNIARHTPEQLVENLGVALPRLIGKVPYDGWKNVQSLEVKTGKSASLPVWNCDLAKRWEGVKEAKEEASESSASEDEEEAAPVKKGKVAVAASEVASEAPKKTKKRSSIGETSDASASGVKKAKKAAA